jgi:hypothetical protein
MNYLVCQEDVIEDEAHRQKGPLICTDNLHKDRLKPNL